MELFKVESYNETQDYHLCRDSSGKVHRIDLMVDGGISVAHPSELVGKLVSVASLNPYIISLAVDVSILGPIPVAQESE